MPNQSPHPFSADRPIRSPEEDLLGRAPFARALADAISAWRQRDSLVVALNGPWGLGKTSVKNLAIDALRELSPGTSAVVEFNPWEWASQDRVSEAFFEEIAASLGVADKSEAGKKRVARWRAYAAMLKVGSTTVTSLRSVFGALFTLLGVLGTAAFLVEDDAFTKGVAVAFALVFLVGVILSSSSRVADAVADLIARKTARDAKSLVEVKADLRNSLAQLTEPILVVIDDIDRLEQGQIRSVFQLIKANADFPNLVFLLLFPRKAIADALSGDYGSGEEFLEKIVQVRFDVPQLDRVRLERVLSNGLNEILDGVSRKTFDSDRWINLYVPGLSPFFETLRDVRRFLGSLAFHVSLLKSGGSFEVNMVDLIGLEVLRIFVPSTYEAVAASKGLLTDAHRDRLGDDEVHRDHIKAGIAQIAGTASEEARERVREILKQLFPNLEWTLGGPHYGSEFSDDWLKQLRVCHSEMFDRYFQLAVPERDISQSHVDKIVDLANDRALLREHLLALHNQGLLAIGVRRLESYKDDIPLSSAVPFVTALFDIGDLLHRGSGFFDLGADTHAIRVVHWYLKRLEDPSERNAALLTAAAETTGLYLPAKKAGIEEAKRTNERDPDLFLLDEDAVGELKRIVVQQIEGAATDGRLRTNIHLAYLLFRWKEWAGDEPVRAWVDHLISTSDGVVLFLVRLASPVSTTSSGSYATRTRWHLRLSNIEALAPVDLVEKMVAGLDQSALEGDAALAVDAFNRAVQRRAEGKSDDPFDDEDF